ncbi:MAG: hypothetical protein JNJ57_17640, partial [Saprospiraceae bacterium]|nr:hypothetical protein [Saprospiraceae bacterium]
MKYFTLFFIATFLLFAAGLHAQCWVLKNVDPNSWEVEDIFFVDSEHGWAAADDGRILKSTDGGNSWQIKQTGIPYDIQSLHFVDTLRGWAIGWDKII